MGSMKIDKNSYPIILVGLLYFIFGKLQFWLISSEKIVTIGIFPPEGIALAFAIFYGKKVLPGIFLGQFFLAYTQGISFLPSILIGLINSFEAYIGIYLFTKFNISKRLKRFKDIILLALIIIFVLQPLSAFLSNTVLMITNQIENKNFILLLFSWWFGNVLGQLVVTPFLLLIFTRLKKISFKKLAIEAFIYGLYLYIIIIVLSIQNPFLLISLSIPIMIFILIKKDICHGVLYSVIVALIASYSIHLQTGAFLSTSAYDNTINFNFFILTHVLLAWLVGILFEERKQFERTLHVKIEQEVKKNQKQQFFLLQQNRLAQMGELISMIAHQWRQPLNNLALINQVLVSKYKKNKLDDEAIKQFDTKSKKIISLMSETIDDFRNFFKIEENIKRFSLNKTTDEMVHIVTPVLEQNGISLSIKAEKEIFLYGHANAFGQVILNIINNAKDALIEREPEKKEIYITLKENEEEIKICIEDTAGGISQNIINKIFDPYFSTKQEK